MTKMERRIGLQKRGHWLEIFAVIAAKMRRDAEASRQPPQFGAANASGCRQRCRPAVRPRTGQALPVCVRSPDRVAVDGAVVRAGRAAARHVRDEIAAALSATSCHSVMTGREASMPPLPLAESSRNLASGSTRSQCAHESFVATQRTLSGDQGGAEMIDAGQGPGARCGCVAAVVALAWRSLAWRLDECLANWAGKSTARAATPHQFRRGAQKSEGEIRRKPNERGQARPNERQRGAKSERTAKLASSRTRSFAARR